MILVGRELQRNFNVKDLGKISYRLWIEFSHEGSAIKLTQKGYITDCLQRFGIMDCKAVSTPLDVNEKFPRDEGKVFISLQRIDQVYHIFGHDDKARHLLRRIPFRTIQQLCYRSSLACS